MAFDLCSNASYDQVNVCRKMHTFVEPGGAGLRPPDQRQPVLLAIGLTLLRRDFDQGAGLAAAVRCTTPPASSATRCGGSRRWTARRSSRTRYSFNVHILLAGQIRGQPHDLYLIYPRATHSARPRTRRSSRSASANTAGRSSTAASGTTGPRSKTRPVTRSISLDSTMRSNVTVGPPIDLLVYHATSSDQPASADSRQGPRPHRDPRALGTGAPQGRPGAPAVQFGEVETPS